MNVTSTTPRPLALTRRASRLDRSLATRLGERRSKITRPDVTRPDADLRDDRDRQRLLGALGSQRSVNGAISAIHDAIDTFEALIYHVEESRNSPVDLRNVLAGSIASAREIDLHLLEELPLPTNAGPLLTILSASVHVLRSADPTDVNPTILHRLQASSTSGLTAARQLSAALAAHADAIAGRLSRFFEPIDPAASDRIREILIAQRATAIMAQANAAPSAALTLLRF